MATTQSSSIMPGPSAAVPPKLRKRTKTGCLTCRKRRIKCGEERPTCNNCIKSKRHCEGYNQRVIWKPPIGDLSGVYPGSTAMPYANAFLSGAHPTLARPVPPPIMTQDPSIHQLPSRPAYGVGFEEPQTAYETGSASLHGSHFGGTRSAPPYSGQNPFSTQLFTPISPPRGQQPFPPHSMAPNNGFIGGQQFQAPLMNTPPQSGPALPPASQYQTSPSFEHQWQQPQSRFPPTPVSISTEYKQSMAEAALPTPTPTLISQPTESLSYVKTDDVKQPYWEGGPNGQSVQRSRQDVAHKQYSDQAHSWKPESVGTVQTPTRQVQTAQAPDARDVPLTGPFTGHYVSPTQLLDDAAVEYEDDDYYDVHSDEDVDVASKRALISAKDEQRDFGMILALHREAITELSMRTYDNFIYAGILDHYRAEWVASPLKNPQTARVFAHFISATGPALSIFERHPRNTSALFDETSSPCSQMGLWTYTLPMMALDHQGLLHAILALSSLHIAKLQQASITPSFKHYAYSLKRLRHCLSHPKKRHFPSTLAATLLLAFYEVMTADHLKWSSHLLGAKQLLVEMDYHLMAKEARKLRALENANDQLSSSSLDGGLVLSPVDPHDDSSIINEDFVSTLVGKKVRYEEFGKVFEEGSSRRKPTELPERFDLGQYDLYQDLFWWYVKQDAYQGIIGGTGLFLDYNRWADCPPRAAVGRLEAIYGTSDHLLLLLGRVVDFQFRDRARKVRYVEANGGQWRPPPGFHFGTEPSAPPPPQYSHHDSTTQAAHQIPQSPMQMRPPSQQSQQPQFFGMAPMPQARHMPASFQPLHPGANDSASPPQAHSKPELDLDTATANAIDEWNQIRSAMEVFASSLGPPFQPLSAEYNHQPAFESPFNGTLQYRSYDIAIMWAMYYMTQIILLRSHPHMPPAAIVAAGIAAPQTAQYAQLIGQICFGIAPTPRGQPLNPSLGATLCEMCMPLFFAGIQYQDAAQRNWLVSRLRDIEARTGWASVGMIAHGCETAWQRAAEAGRGPPYQRHKVDSVEFLSMDDRVRRQGVLFDEGEAKDLTDRRYVLVHPPTRVHWALGLLGLEQDVERSPELPSAQF